MAQVTLCAVDTRTPALAAQSLLRSMDHVDFGRVMLFTDGWTPRRVIPGIELVDIDAVETEAAYSNFILRKLPYFIRSSHALITRWDGFVVNPAAWTPEFLVHDFVAAVWPDQPEGRNVGHGGFSLRSRRFLRAGLDPRIPDGHPEDLLLCQTRRAFLEREHGISFAPSPLARRFAFGDESPSDPVFGFHGAWNLPRYLDEATLERWLLELSKDFYGSRDSQRLAQALLFRGMPLAASHVLERCRAVGFEDGRTELLAKAAGAMSALRFWKS